MSVQHDPEIMWIITKVIPIVQINKSIMDSNDSNVIVFSDFIISLTVELLQTTQPIIVVIPKNGLIQNLNDGNCVTPFGSI